MKKLAIFTLVLVLLAAGAAVWLYMTCNVTLSAVSAISTDATDQDATFNALKRDMENGALIGMPYTQNPPGEAKDYRFITYTIRMDNNTFVAADMIEVQITPGSGDVLQIGSTETLALTPRSQGDLSATILTDVRAASSREAVVTYYLWGMPFTQKVSVGR